jgi:hypothetical protein
MASGYRRLYRDHVADSKSIRKLTLFDANGDVGSEINSVTNVPDQTSSNENGRW